MNDQSSTDQPRTDQPSTDQPSTNQPSTNRPSTNSLGAEEQRLVTALEVEAGRIQPSSTALTTIQRRIGELATPLEQARARRHRRTGVAAGAIAFGLAAAATIFAVNGGIQRQTVPGPAQTPTSSPTPTAGPTTADVEFDPSSPRTSWTVYREATIDGRPGLVTEEVRARPPVRAAAGAGGAVRGGAARPAGRTPQPPADRPGRSQRGGLGGAGRRRSRGRHGFGQPGQAVRHR